jgi:hypothetical protein
MDETDDEVQRLLYGTDDVEQRVNGKSNGRGSYAQHILGSNKEGKPASSLPRVSEILLVAIHLLLKQHHLAGP